MRPLDTLLLAVVLAHAPGCSSPPRDQSPETVTVTVGVQPFLTYAPFFLAAVEGDFAAQGLEVILAPMPSGEHGMAQLVSGQIDVFGGFPSPGLFNLVSRGAQIRIVADRGYLAADGCDYYVLVARQGIPPDSIEQLIGRTIRIDPALPSYWFDRLLAPAGYSIDDLETIDFPAPGIEDALQSGAIDLAFIGDPYRIHLTRSESAYVWASAQDWMPEAQFSVVLYGSRLLAQDPDLGERFMAAYLRAVARYNTGPTELNLQILTAGLGQPRDILESSCWLPIRSDGQVELESLLDFQRWALRRGLIDREVPVDQVWDPRFIEAAGRALAAAGGQP